MNFKRIFNRIKNRIMENDIVVKESNVTAVDIDALSKEDRDRLEVAEKIKAKARQIADLLVADIEQSSNELNEKFSVQIGTVYSLKESKLPNRKLDFSIE